MFEIQKGEKYNETARKLSDIIAGLHLRRADNENLIYSIIEHVNAARLEAYQQGYSEGNKETKGGEKHV